MALHSLLIAYLRESLSFKEGQPEMTQTRLGVSLYLVYFFPFIFLLCARVLALKYPAFHFESLQCHGRFMVLPQMITEGGLLRTSKAWGEPDFCGLLQFLFLSGLASGPTGFEVIHLHNSDLIFLVGNYASSGALYPFTEIIIFKSPESGYIIQGKYNIRCWTSKMSTIKYFF